MSDKTITSFPTMGTSAASAENLSGAPSTNTISRPRGGSKTSDTSATANHRKGVLERNGFKGAPQVAYSYPNAPEASLEQRNVRLMSSVAGRLGNFYAKRAEGPAIG